MKMNEDKITELLEGHDISDDKIAHIVDQMKERFKRDIVKIPVKNDFIESEIENEKNPFKKAVLIAKKISKSFDEE